MLVWDGAMGYANMPQSRPAREFLSCLFKAYNLFDFGARGAAKSFGIRS